MLTFAVFCLAGSIVMLTSGAGLWNRTRPGGPRPEAISFIGAVLFAALCGWAVTSALHFNDIIPDQVGASGAATVRRGIQYQDALLLLVTGGLYALSAIRGARGVPPWVADVFVLIAAGITVFLHPGMRIQGITLPFSYQYMELGLFGSVLTIAWIWLMARMTAALNRTPQVTGGYLGIVALTFLLLWHISPASATAASLIPPTASAALAGAGLISVPVALRLPGFNLGWSGALAMGFLLAHIAIIGLFNTVALAILTMLLLVFGLPILDVSFYRLRAARRGEKVTWEQRHLRLHKALLQRGISPAKVAVLYLSITAFLCGVGLLLLITDNWNPLLRILLIGTILFVGFVTFFSLTRILMRRGETEEIPEEVEAFGVRISPVTMSEALDKMETFIESRQPHHVVTSDANAILRAQEDEEYAGIIQRAALITPDGYGVIWGARLLNLPIYERVTGVDMVTGICERGAKKGYSIYILGSAPGIASTAAQKLADRYKGLKVAGTQHGYFKPEEEADVIRRIREARPDVLFVAFGIPKQEKFIAKHLHEMNVPVSLGVGGSFDVYSEKLRRAPEYIQRIGMEWLYRVWQEPWRWKRMSYVPRFMLFALREWLFGPGHARRNHKPHNAAPQ